MVQIDKRVQELKHEMNTRIKTDKNFQASVNEKIQSMTDAQTTLSKTVEDNVKTCTTVKKDLENREEQVKKHVDALKQDIDSAQAKVADV